MKRIEKEFDFESRPSMPVNGCPPALAHCYQDEPPPPGSYQFSPLQDADQKWVKRKESTYRILYHIRTKPGFEEYYVLVKYDAETDQVVGKIIGQKEADAFQRIEPMLIKGKTAIACVFDPEKKILILKDGPLALECDEEDVIKILIEARAITLQKLKDKSNCSNPNRVLKNLIKKYPDLKEFIFLPGKKGQGGYKTAIEFANSRSLPETI